MTSVSRLTKTKGVLIVDGREDEDKDEVVDYLWTSPFLLRTFFFC